MMAFRVAVLEKIATGLGVMAFVWATVVLLEATKVLSRSHELEWQHAVSHSLSIQSTKPKKASMDQKISAELPHANREAENTEQSSISLEDPTPDGCFPFEIQRTWTFAAVPFISHSNLFVARQVSSMLYILQLMSAAVSIALSIRQLSSQRFISDKTHDDRSKLLSLALNVFYALALMQSLVFLLLLQVQTRYNFLEGQSLEMVKDFFYDAYSASLKKSIFDGLAMDLVGYSITQIQSNSAKQQLGGMHILLAFVKQKELKANTLRRIGTTPDALNRLLQMLTWKNHHEMQIRLAAASILKRLVQYNGNRFKVVAIPGALEAISSLLASEEDYCRNEQNVTPLFSKMIRLRGLRILKELTKVHSNCVRIGSIRGLRRILVTLIQVRHGFVDGNSALDLKAFTVSLHLIKLLTTTTGKSGKILGDQIGRTVFLLRNLRDIIVSRGQMTSKESALDMVICLALDNHRREEIGRTGGMITNLLMLFLTREETLKAGEALNLILLQNSKNCRRLLDLNHFSSSSLQNYCEDPRIGACVAKMLRSLFVYFTPNQKDAILALAPYLMRMAVKSMESSTITYQEALLGFLALMVPSLSTPPYELIFSHTLFTKQTFLNEFMNMVERLPSFDLDSYPRIRRHIVELAIALMRHDNVQRQALKDGQAFEHHLREILETVSEVENYYTISGQIGLTRHLQTMENLIEVAITELHKQ
ncbi:hypothetical protein O6H91_08G061500 [Diphasiastrum complanatum]|uniref:Uncharacterized protein n=1 Tax=Diphasiastrum complanatum TaxID=34168 RepID=A0ACC2CY44_DIPCM|nr:hypothetical protein O6H91_08G061500 [Diphasiastrum complanatum]